MAAPGRMIRQSFYTSADLTDQPAWVRLLFSGLIVFASQSGHVRANIRQFRNTILQGLRISEASIEHALDTFVARSMLTPCILEGVSHYKITNFKVHQNLRSYIDSLEHRRRTMNDGTENDDGAEPSEPGPRQAHPSPPPEDLAGMELYAADRKLCGKWPGLLAAWRTAYPGVEVLAEVRKAHAWEVSNPSRRKVNRASFLAKWLARAQDGQSTGSGPSPARTGRRSTFNPPDKWDGVPGA